jgi:hypothetical protein
VGNHLAGHSPFAWLLFKIHGELTWCSQEILWLEPVVQGWQDPLGSPNWDRVSQRAKLLLTNLFIAKFQSVVCNLGHNLMWVELHL